MPFQHGANTVQLPYLLPRGQLKFHCLKACLRCQVYQLYLVIACTRVQACVPLIQLWVFEFISYLCSCLTDCLTDLNHRVEVILSPISCQNYLTNAPMPTSQILPSLTLGKVRIPTLSNLNVDTVDPKIAETVEYLVRIFGALQVPNQGLLE